MPMPMIFGGAGKAADAVLNNNFMNYMTGAEFTPKEAMNRGAAGVLGGTLDNLTLGYTDFDKRGDSKKQKDAKNFLNAFIFGKGRGMTGDFNTPGTGMTA